jgi:hypothetical protein
MKLLIVGILVLNFVGNLSYADGCMPTQEGNGCRTVGHNGHDPFLTCVCPAPPPPPNSTGQEHFQCITYSESSPNTNFYGYAAISQDYASKTAIDSCSKFLGNDCHIRNCWSVENRQ